MNTVTIKFDYKLISTLLLVVILVMLAIWQPWNTVTGRTVVVSGQATVKAAPDEFTFYPTYQSKSKNSTDAISAVSKTGNGVVKKIQSLGVDGGKITTNVTTGDYFGIKAEGEITDTNEVTALFSITAVTNDKAIAQKVLDYLVTTGPLYGVSPQSNFATETRRDLENDARKLALADAKSRADQTATELGIKIGRVVEVSEPNWGGIIPLMEDGVSPGASRGEDAAQTSPKLLIGEQEVTYQISVTYRIR